jgi:hypothetical protein
MDRRARPKVGAKTMAGERSLAMQLCDATGRLMRGPRGGPTP